MSRTRISNKVAADLTLRFQVTPGWKERASGNAIAELVKALQNVARDEKDAAKIVSQCLEFGTFCPAPADIYRAAEIVHAAADPGWEPVREPPPDCSICHDYGQFLNHHGRHQRCRCAAAAAISEEMVAKMNELLCRPHAAPKPHTPRPDLDKVLEHVDGVYRNVA